MKEHLTIVEAIQIVMREAGVPLSIKEVYERIVEAELYEFHAQQPRSVVHSQIRRHCVDFDFPSASPTKLFGMSNDGRFYPLETACRYDHVIETGSDGAASEEESPLSATLRQIKVTHQIHRNLLKELILRELMQISPVAFERFARRLLEVYGFEDVKVTSINNDGGIDGYGQFKIGLAYMRVAFQCKRWTQNNVGRPEIDQFRGAIQGSFEQGIYFTTADFTKGAKSVSIKPGAVPIVLINGDIIVEMMIEKGFGVESEMLPVYTYALDVILAEEDEN